VLSWRASTSDGLAALDRYVWLIGNGGNTGARIAWTPSLGACFGRHFLLLRYASAFRGQGNVPRGGLYVRA
jgi:hypothetical protein